MAIGIRIPGVASAFAPSRKKDEFLGGMMELAHGLAGRRSHQLDTITRTLHEGERRHRPTWK
jgi:hypothetical protein